MVAVGDATMMLLAEAFENLSATVTDTEADDFVDIAEAVAFLSTFGPEEDGVRTAVAPEGTAIVSSGATTEELSPSAALGPMGVPPLPNEGLPLVIV